MRSKTEREIDNLLLLGIEILIMKDMYEYRFGKFKNNNVWCNKNHATTVFGSIFIASDVTYRYLVHA